jgi:PKD repeat protein
LQSFQSAPSHLRAKRTLLGALVVIVVGCLWAPAALGQATKPDFTVDPPSPIVGGETTFTSSNIPDGSTVTWQYGPDYDSNGTFVPENTHTFAAPGPYEVTMRVANGGPPDDFTKTVVVRPVAAFHRDPAESVILEIGQEATFISDSTPGSTLSWEIDGAASGGGQSVTRTFAASGLHVVRLEVVQNGVHNVATSTFRVNAPPVPGFVWTPGSPVAGSATQLYSTAVDAEGPLASQAWELDGDGDFNDAFGSSATRAFTAGDHDVSLRVTDSDGVTRTITRRITVAAALITSAVPRLMNPFPTVRMAGLIVPRGVRNALVEVRGAPRGARVTVRCTGTGCPFRSRRRIAETGRVRFSAFRRLLVGGARIEVFVRSPGVIGKYVAFRIRAGKRPLRVDRCLMPGASDPTRCA